MKELTPEQKFILNEVRGAVLEGINNPFRAFPLYGDVAEFNTLNEAIEYCVEGYK